MQTNNVEKLATQIPIRTNSGQHYRAEFRSFDGCYVILSTIGHPLKYRYEELLAAKEGNWPLSFENGQADYMGWPKPPEPKPPTPGFWQTLINRFFGTE